MDPQTPEQRRLVRRLFERRTEGEFVPFEAVEMGEWMPVQHYCHDNVAEWVKANPDWKVVRGWLYFEFSLDLCPQFLAHSVVESPDGRLVDITPRQASRSYPFIRHKGDMLEFDRLVGEWELVRINYRG